MCTFTFALVFGKKGRGLEGKGKGEVTWPLITALMGVGP